MEAMQIFKDYSHTKMRNPMDAMKFCITVCLSNIYYGYTLIYISGIDFSVIAQQYNIDFDIHTAQGIFQGVMPIGGAIGAVSSVYFITKFSRREVLNRFAFIAILLCLLSLIPDYRLFLLVRFLQGATAGTLSSVCPMIIKQSSPLELSSITGALNNLFIILGLFFLYFFSFILGLLSGDSTGASTWQIIFLFPILLLLIQTFILMKIYPFETPKYLAMKKRKEQLRQLMQFYYKPQYIEQEYEYICKHFCPRESRQDNIHHKHYQCRAAFIYGLFYAILTPMVGINVMLSYCNEIAASIFPSLKPIIGTIMLFLFFFFSAVSIGYVNRYGRKEMTLWGTYGLIVALYLLTFGYFISDIFPSLAQLIIFVMLILYLFVYGMTYAPVMWMWLSEAIQPHLLGYTITLNWSAAASVMIGFPIVQNLVPNQGYIFAFFGSFAVFSLYITNKYMLQTKDKTEHQITQEYKKLDFQLYGHNEPQPESLEVELIEKEPKQ